MSSYRNRNYNRSGYVPKWKKDEDSKKSEEDAKLKSLKNTEDNFPSLGGNMVSPKQSWSTGAASFKDLASEWRQKEEMEKMNAEAVKNETSVFPEVVLPKFNNVHRYTDDEVVEENEDEEKFEHIEEPKKVEHSEQGEDDGWVTVQHKKPKKDKGAKKSEEIQNLTEEDFETSSQGSDTVWNAHLAGGPRGKNTFG